MFIDELSTFLTNAFNTIGSDLGSKIQFKFDAETGKNDNAKILQGIIKTESTSQLPVKGVKSVKYKYKVELPIPSSLSNKNVILVNSIVEQFSTQYNGTNLDLTDGKGVMTMTMPSTGSFKTEFGQGNIVPLVFTIDLLFTQGAITSGDKVWLLDNYVIPYTYEGLVVEKAGKTSLINDRKYAQTLSTSQTKYYHFKFAYDSNNELCVQLQKDLLEGDANKVYTLKYYDGKSYTVDAPYQTKVVINRNGDTSSAVPDTAFFDLWFTDADDGNNETKYYMALIDDPFDGTTENERYFNTEAEQQLWYANLISTGANYCEIKAPNLNSLYLTDQIYTNTAVSGGYDVFDLVNKNFAVIKAVRPATADYLIEIRKPSYDDACAMGNVYWRGTIDGQTVYRKVATPSSPGGGISRDAYNQTISQVWTNERFFYYRVTDAQIGLNKQMSYNLRLNSFQTYYFQENPDATKKLSITGSFIEKAHLDRWLYGYEIVNKTAGTKPTQETAIANMYYGKTPDNTTISSTDTFTKITANNYANFTYLYAPIVTFNGKADSKLFEREDLKDVAKRLVSREKLQMQLPTSSRNSEICDYINKYVVAWVYIVLDIGKYNFPVESSGTIHTHQVILPETRHYIVKDEIGEQAISTYGYSTACICYPIYRDGFHTMGFKKTGTAGLNTVWGENALDKFLSENNAYSKVKSVKISIKPPFDLKHGGFLYSIEESTITIPPITYTYYSLRFSSKDRQSGSGTSENWLYELNSDVVNINDRIVGSDDNGAILIYDKDYTTPLSLTTESAIWENSFKVLDILPSGTTEKDRNKKWNPKLSNEDYKDVRLVVGGSSFDYSLQKLNTVKPSFDYVEMITPDITKAICRFKSENNDDIFASAYNTSFNGLIFTNDFSLPYANGQLDLYLANNKNAYLSFQTQQKQSRVNSLIGLGEGALRGGAGGFMAGGAITGGFSAVGGAVAGAVGGALDSIVGVAKNEINLSFQKQQFDMSIDNMRNAPDTLMNANGNVSFIGGVDEFGLYLEIYEAIDNELEMANDNMFKEGYTFNRFGQIRDCDHIRKHFNYVRGLLGVMNGIPMSDNVRADLRNMFAQGIRMWTSDNIEYTKENYEVKLETI